MKTEKKIKVLHTLPQGKWREKYACRKLKGDHTFQLVKPKFLGWVPAIHAMSVREYYEHEELRRAEEMVKGGSALRSWFGVTYYWKCTACGKEEWESTHNSNKKIKIRSI